MAIVLDGSRCIVLEVAEGPGGRVLRRVAVTDVNELATALATALGEAERERQDAIKQARLGPNQYTRRAAEDYLVSGGVSRGEATQAVESTAWTDATRAALVHSAAGDEYFVTYNRHQEIWTIG
jgi:hypothetical protein